MVARSQRSPAIYNRILGRLGNSSSASSDPASQSASASNRQSVGSKQIEIEALVAQPSHFLLNQATRNNPFAIRVWSCVVSTVGPAEPGTPQQENGRLLLNQIY
jgi:hypothetical protein